MPYVHSKLALRLLASPSTSKLSEPEHRQGPSPRWVPASSDRDVASGSSVSQSLLLKDEEPPGGEAGPHAPLIKLQINNKKFHFVISIYSI